MGGKVFSWEVLGDKITREKIEMCFETCAKLVYIREDGIFHGGIGENSQESFRKSQKDERVSVVFTRVSRVREDQRRNQGLIPSLCKHS